MTIRGLHHARLATRRALRPGRAPRGSAADVVSTLPSRTPPPAPADFAFTHDPLTGSILREESAAGHGAEVSAAGSALPLDAGVYHAAEPDPMPLPAAVTDSWSELEHAAVPYNERIPGDITRSVPAPTAVH